MDPSEQKIRMDHITEVLTNCGWRSIDTLSCNEKVADWDNGRITFVKPLEIARRVRQPGERMFVLKTRQRNIRISEHRLVAVMCTGGWSLRPAGSLEGLTCGLPVCGEASPEVLHLPVPPPTANRKIAVARRRLQLVKTGIEPAAALAESERLFAERNSLRHLNPDELSIAQCQLLGFWQGDGSTLRSKHGGCLQLLDQSETNPRIVRWIDDLLRELEIDHRKYHNKAPAHSPHRIFRWTLPRGTGFGARRKRGVFALEPYFQKSENPLLWGFSREQLLAYLQGLWIADGGHGQFDQGVPDSLDIYSVRRGLLDHLQAIAACRGLNAAITRKSPAARPGRQVQYRLHVTQRPYIRLVTDSTAEKHNRAFRPESEWRRESLWSVRTRSGSVVTRRGGRVAILGSLVGSATAR